MRQKRFDLDKKDFLIFFSLLGSGYLVVRIVAFGMYGAQIGSGFGLWVMAVAGSLVNGLLLGMLWGRDDLFGAHILAYPGGFLLVAFLVGLPLSLVMELIAHGTLKAFDTPVEALTAWGAALTALCAIAFLPLMGLLFVRIGRYGGGREAWKRDLGGVMRALKDALNDWTTSRRKMPWE